MNSKHVVAGVLTGAVIGATLGILFAPDKGSVTRKKISKKSSDLIDSITKKFEKMKKEVTALVENGQPNAEEVEVL
jgi:gas vesicle protein